MAARGYAFPRRSRLIRGAEFAAVFARRCSAGDRYFSCHGKPNGLDRARLGLAVSRKAARTAVARNRIKRQVREAFRRRQSGITGLDIVVVARPAAAAAPAPALRNSLEGLWTKLAEKCKDC